MQVWRHPWPLKMHYSRTSDEVLGPILLTSAAKQEEATTMPHFQFRWDAVKETDDGLESSFSICNPVVLSYISFPKMSLWFWLTVSTVLDLDHTEDTLWLIHQQPTRFSCFQLVRLPVLQESYPSTPPIWFVDSDDPSLAEVLERLEDVRKGSTLVSPRLVSRLRWSCVWADLYNSSLFFSCFLLSFSSSSS